MYRGRRKADVLDTLNNFLGDGARTTDNNAKGVFTESRVRQATTETRLERPAQSCTLPLPVVTLKDLDGVQGGSHIVELLHRRNQLSRLTSGLPLLHKTNSKKHFLKKSKDYNSKCDLWGFKVIYSPDVDDATIAEYQEEERKLTDFMQALQQQSEERRVWIQKKRRMKRADTSKYLHYSQKYGALNGILYCCTDTPGKVYEVLLSQASRKLQKWFRFCLQASKTFSIQRASQIVVQQYMKTGLTMVTESILKEKKSILYLKRLLNQLLVRCLKSWSQEVKRSLQVKKMFQRAILAGVQKSFARWKDFLVMVKSFREDKINQTSIRIFRRHLFDCFIVWKQKSARSKKIHSFLGAKQQQKRRHIFDRWVHIARTTKLVNNACITIQRYFRGYHTRKSLRSKRSAAITIQALIRGVLSRIRYHAYRLDCQQAITCVRDVVQHDITRRYDAQNDDIRRGEEEEANRFRCEMKSVHDAMRRARADALRQLALVLPNEPQRALKRYMAELKQTASASGTQLGTKEAGLLAMEKVLRQTEEEAKTSATLAFRRQTKDGGGGPPPAACSDCLRPFARAVYLRSHVCADSEDEVAKKIQLVREREWEEQRQEKILAMTAPIKFKDYEPYLKQKRVLPTHDSSYC